MFVAMSCSFGNKSADSVSKNPSTPKQLLVIFCFCHIFTHCGLIFLCKVKSCTSIDSGHPQLLTDVLQFSYVFMQFKRYKSLGKRKKQTLNFSDFVIEKREVSIKELIYTTLKPKEHRKNSGGGSTFEESRNSETLLAYFVSDCSSLSFLSLTSSLQPV